jgi:uncharacterized Zn finger protein
VTTCGGANFSFEQQINFDCPSCGSQTQFKLPKDIVISCTVRCVQCGCTVGLSGKGMKSQSIIRNPSRENGVAWTMKHDPTEPED